MASVPPPVALMEQAQVDGQERDVGYRGGEDCCLRKDVDEESAQVWQEECDPVLVIMSRARTLEMMEQSIGETLVVIA